MYSQKPPTRKSLVKDLNFALKWSNRVSFCSKYEILDKIGEMCSQYKNKLAQAKFLNALFSWGTAE